MAELLLLRKSTRVMYRSKFEKVPFDHVSGNASLTGYNKLLIFIKLTVSQEHKGASIPTRLFVW